MSNELIRYLIDDINDLVKEDIKIMEVCGTHTQMIAKLGLKSLLTNHIQLLSGPGCPVCVTSEDEIDAAISLLKYDSVTLATFGDLMRVRGTHESLLDRKSKGDRVLIIHSPLELIKRAEENKDKIVVFFGVGFETTAPIIALTIKTAAEKGISNLFFLTSLKLMNPILQYILNQESISINGFLCPGHVATIKGSDYFNFICSEYKKPAVVCGFEALDIVSSIHFLVQQITNKNSQFENYYRRCVSNTGNPTANLLMNEVFECIDGLWRGIGWVKNSSLVINTKYQFLDATNVFTIEKIREKKRPFVCLCSDILLGNKAPIECPLFITHCNPHTPHGPCMVSSEGACSVAYHYREDQ